MQTATIEASAQGGLKAAKASKSKGGKSSGKGSFDDMLQGLAGSGETADQIQQLLASMGFNVDYSFIAQLMPQNSSGGASQQSTPDFAAKASSGGQTQATEISDTFAPVSMSGLGFLSRIATSNGSSQTEQGGAENTQGITSLPNCDMQGAAASAGTQAKSAPAATDVTAKQAIPSALSQTDFSDMLSTRSGSAVNASVQANPQNTLQALEKGAAQTAQPAVQTVQAAASMSGNISDSQPKAVSTVQTADAQSVQSVSAAENGAKASGSNKDGSGKSDDSAEHKGSGSPDTAQVLTPVTHTKAFDIKDTTGASSAEKTSVAQQMSDAVKQAVQNGRSEVRIHLSPEDLGGINIKIVSHGGELTLQITADSAKTGQLIASSMNELNQSMKDSGVNMSHADVLFSDSGSFGATYDSQHQAGQQSQSYSMPKWTPAMDSDQTSTLPAADTAASAGMSILA